MTAQDVYNIAKALPKEEYIHLYAMLQGSLSTTQPNVIKKATLITDLQAQQYLLKNIFSEESIKNRIK
ncbi:hypothetical protein [Algibacter mikhailovii]|uniref:Uncharacterized protein n=1 Tax=Algibacter mikhailovii TaxID=425498 RepID=A0A918QW23_9FLAO|nr:hypothetical protein [Algibacter mikhailovii]GGZ72573.1 hypothetical protein GCM10007028_07000 [Algibacter mikhailovii]